MPEQKNDHFTVVLSRLANEAESYGNELKENGITVITIPFIYIKPIEDEISRMTDLLKSEVKFDWIVFTSKTAVEIVCQRALSYLNLPYLNFASVGPATTEALSLYGHKVSYESCGQNADSLAEEISNKFNFKNQLVLLPLSKSAKQGMELTLNSAGAMVRRYDIYEPAAKILTQAEIDAVLRSDLVCYFSPSAVRSIVNQTDGRVLNINSLAIGPITFRELEKFNFKKISVCDNVSVDALKEQVLILKNKKSID
jgi:uroporphyrinogen-III synthase